MLAGSPVRLMDNPLGLSLADPFFSAETDDVGIGSVQGDDTQLTDFLNLLSGGEKPYVGLAEVVTAAPAATDGGVGHAGSMSVAAKAGSLLQAKKRPFTADGVVGVADLDDPSPTSSSASTVSGGSSEAHGCCGAGGGEEKRAKRKYARRACGPCARQKVGCDDERPCRRCVRLNRAKLCVDGCGVDRRRKKKAPTDKPEVSGPVLPPQLPVERTLDAPGVRLVTKTGGGLTTVDVKLTVHRHQLPLGLYSLFWGNPLMFSVRPADHARALATWTASVTSQDSDLEAAEHLVEEAYQASLRVTPHPTFRVRYSATEQRIVQFVCNDHFNRLQQIPAMDTAKGTKVPTHPGAPTCIVHPEDSDAYMHLICSDMLDRRTTRVVRNLRFVLFDDEQRKMYQVRQVINYEYYPNGFPRSRTHYYTDVEFLSEFSDSVPKGQQDLLCQRLSMLGAMHSTLNAADPAMIQFAAAPWATAVEAAVPESKEL